MRCLQCGKRLLLLRKPGSGAFCSDAHRRAFLQEQEELALSRLIDAQQQVQRPAARPEKEKKKSSKRRAEAEVARLHGPIPERLPMVEWSWHGLRKQPSDPLEVPPAAILPRAGFRKEGRLTLAMRCGLPAMTAVRHPAVPRASEWTKACPIAAPRSWRRLDRTAGVVAVRTGTQTAETMQAGRVAVRQAGAGAREMELPLPVAGLVGWGVRIEVRPGRREQRHLMAVAVPLRSGWNPASYPRTGFGPDEIPVPPGPETEDRLGPAGLFQVAPAMQPVPAAPVWPQPQALRTASGPAIPGRMRSRVARMPSAWFQAVELRCLAAGEWHKVMRLAGPIAARGVCRWPGLGSGNAPRLRSAGPVPVPVPEAQWGNRILPQRARPEPGTPSLTRPRCKPLGAVNFTPEAAGIQPLTLYVRDGGETGAWRQSAESEPEPPAERRAVAPASRARPMCDWVPTMARVVALRYELVSQAALGHPVCDREPAQAVTRPAVRPALPGRPTADLQPSSSERLLRIPAERTMPPQSATKPRPEWTPAAAQPARRCPGSRMSPRTPELAPSPHAEGGIGQELAGRFRNAWQRVPAVPKWTLFAMAAAFALMRYVPAPEPGAEPGPDTLQIVWDGWAAVQRNIMERAAVSISDDFRSGLSAWQGDRGWAEEWSYDSSGFVRTGALALLTPTLGLEDYRMEFLGLIERRSLGWVVRATDTRNYMAVKLTIMTPGPVPEVAIQRWTVIDGKPGPLRQKRLPLQARTDTLYRVGTEVRGPNYTLTVQDKVVDTWTESGLRKGGVGFFSGKGEQARLRWVGVWHQYDTLGRLCALIAPQGLPGTERED